MPLINSGTYTGVATLTSEKYTYDLTQNSIAITNNDSTNKIFVQIGDHESVVFPGMTYNLVEEFTSFVIKTVNNRFYSGVTASFTAVTEEINKKIDTQILFSDKIEGTTTIVTTSGDDITQILHMSGETLVRQDDYTYPDENTIQEVRTYIPTNDTVTMVYDLISLSTTVSAITKGV